MANGIGNTVSVLLNQTNTMPGDLDGANVPGFVECPSQHSDAEPGHQAAAMSPAVPALAPRGASSY